MTGAGVAACMSQQHVAQAVLLGRAISPGGGRAAGRMPRTRPNLGLGGGALVPTRTQNFHHFLKLALTKNPKKRPTAEKLLQVGGRDGPMLRSRACVTGPNLIVPPPQHPFTTQHLPRALLTQLLDKASDPHLGTPSPEDCELEVSWEDAGKWALACPGQEVPKGGVGRGPFDLPRSSPES